MNLLHKTVIYEATEILHHHAEINFGEIPVLHTRSVLRTTSSTSQCTKHIIPVLKRRIALHACLSFPSSYCSYSMF